MTAATQARPAGPMPGRPVERRPSLLRRIRARSVPYFLVLPGTLWLAIFFIVPMVAMASLSLTQGDITYGFPMTWHFQNYWYVLTTFRAQVERSAIYGGISTIVQIALAYPIAYWIAFRGGRRKNMYLFLLLLPFFVSFVLRTRSWQMMLADNGVIIGSLHSIGLLPANFHILQTTWAVIGGLTYNYLPFMILPIYVALERVDPRLIEAAYDLYASRPMAFRKVILPLSLPGVFAGVVITFVPVASDYVNAQLLGGPGNTMIGNIIQNYFLYYQQYPVAAALSFVLMAGLLIFLFVYARILGTEQVLSAAAR